LCFCKTEDFVNTTTIVTDSPKESLLSRKKVLFITVNISGSIKFGKLHAFCKALCVSVFDSFDVRPSGRNVCVGTEAFPRTWLSDLFVNLILITFSPFQALEFLFFQGFVCPAS
jgi:hypothetical protein